QAWTLIDEGETVRLEPWMHPGPAALAWWAWAPVLLACGAGLGGGGVGIAAACGLTERVVAVVRTRGGAVSGGRMGVGVRVGEGRVLVPWPRAEVLRVSDGLLVGVPNAPSGHVSNRLTNFAAVAPVIETKSQLGLHSATVHFRVRLEDGALAVVGEVEPM